MVVAMLAFAFVAALPALGAPAIPNPSFEANAAFEDSPGYVADNPDIIGWTASPANSVGLNPTAVSTPFANNGAIPNGTRVAFVQSNAGLKSSLSTTITGLVVGTHYRVQFRANRRSGLGTPAPSYRLNGAAPVRFIATPAVGGLNPYLTVNGIFTATATTAGLEISNTTATDSTVLVDNFTITAATAIQVTNVNNDGPGSLRQVLVTAAASSAFNVVTFAPALSGQTITLLSDILVNDAGGVVIDSSGLPAGITLDGGPGTNRIFALDTSNLMSLRKLTLTGGNGSGAFSVQGSTDGGAIFNRGTLAMTQCTLFDNSTGPPSGFGGAIENFSTGHVELTQCTLSANTALSDGGAIDNFGGIVALTHCTISGNAALNGGGIESNGKLIVTNSIIAGNIAATATADIHNSGGTSATTVTRVGANIIQVLTNSIAAIDNSDPATININASPQLVALADNGGPTKTMGLQTASPARNASVLSTVTSDQRGKPIQGVPNIVADIGAFEVQRGTFVFDRTGYTGTEGFDLEVSAVILRIGGFEGEASVKITSSPGTASAADFTAIPVASQTVNFADGEEFKTRSMAIANDGIVESNEIFNVTLSPTSASTSLGSPATATVTIVDETAFNADTIPPGAPVITSPAAGAVVNVNVGGTLRVTGTATDNKGVRDVKIRVITAGGAPSSFTNVTLAAPNAPSTGWTATITPVAGINTIEVRSSTIVGVNSTTVARTFKVLRPLTVRLAGNGSVTTGFAPSSFREVGQRITITATPSAAPPPGNIFTKWTIASGELPGDLGLLASSLEKPTLSFIFREGLILIANFVPNPFTPLAGQYNGLIHASTNPSLALPNGTTPGNSTEGLFTATVTGTGAFSGRLTIDGTVLSMAGVFDDGGVGRFGSSRSKVLAVARTGKPSLEVSFEMDIDPNRTNDTISGDVIATDFQRTVTTAVSRVTADRAFYDGLTVPTTAFDGKFTVVFPSKAPFKTATVHVDGANNGFDTVFPAGSLVDNDRIVFAAPAPGGLTAGQVFFINNIGSGRFTLLDTTGGLPTIEPSVNATFTVIFDPEARQIKGLGAPDYPQGDGFGFLTISKAGVVTLFSGRLADNTVVTASTRLSKEDEFPLFLPLYNKKGYLSGEVELIPSRNDSDFSAVNLQWLRPFDATSHYYPHGWPQVIRVDCLGAIYAPTFTPASSVLRRADSPDAGEVGDPLLAPDPANGNAKLSFFNGQLSGALNRTVNISTTNAISKVPANDTSFTLSLTAATGAFSGTFVHENNEGVAVPLTTPYQGVIYQKGVDARGFGFFRTRQPSPIDFTGESGSVTLLGVP